MRKTTSKSHSSKSSAMVQSTDQRVDLLWPQVHALSLLAQLGSFTAVALRLAISKAAVSQRLSDLERDIGQTLVHRTTRSLRLTEAGERLVARTADSFAQISRGVAEARELATSPRGLIRVSAPVALGRQEIAPAIEAFCIEHADVRIELELSDRLLSLANEGFDLAIRHASKPPDNYVAWQLASSRSLLVGSSGYLRRCGTPTHPDELAQHACLSYLRPGRASWPFERVAGAPGEEPERVRVAVSGPLRANNSEVLRNAALAGLGLAVLPHFSASPALRSGKLCELLTDWRPVGAFGEAIWAIRPWSPHTPKAVNALIAHLRTVLAARLKLD